VSQMPDVAGSWPEEGTQYVPGAPMEPVQQPYQPQAQYQQQYPQQQGYQDPQQYAQQQQYQQQYAQQQYAAAQQQPPYQEQTVPQQAVFGEEEQSAVPSEFDHLFRDSAPDDRRSISGRQPVVSGPGAAASPGFPQAPAAQQQAAQQAQATAVYNQAQGAQLGGAPAFEDRPPVEYGGNQPFGGGYGGPGGAGGPGSGSRRNPLIIGGVVVVIAAVGLYLGLSGGSPSAGNSPTTGSSTTATAHASNETAQQQAAAVYKLVQQSKQLRSDINAEVGALDSCSNVSSLQAEITATAQNRQTQADKVATLDVSKISGGAAVTSALNKAWTDSATSDADYAKAAADLAGSCSKSAVKHNPDDLNAVQGSNKASTEKDNAADLWNQTMTNYGQPQISESDL